MKKKLQSVFSTRQYMLKKDFELYYYSDTKLKAVSTHTHDYYEFYFFLEGEVDIVIEGEINHASFGDIILIPPNIEHKTIIRSQQIPYRRFVFWISKEYCEQLKYIANEYFYLFKLVEKEKKYVYGNDVISFNMIYSKLIRLLEEINSNRFGHDAQIELYIKDLILHLNRHIYEVNNLDTYTKEESLYKTVLSYIEENIETDLSLDKLSEVFYVSKYHIAHIFKDNLGISIHQYITKKRLSKCKDAITSNLNITKTYELYGFKDYSGFYRAFKKEYGISPKECQEMSNANRLTTTFAMSTTK